MTHKTFVIAVTMVVLTSLCSGCLWAPELDRVRKDIEQQLPGSSFKREFALSLGPLSLGIARTIIRMVPEAAEAREYLKDVSRVTVAVYEVSDVPTGANVKMPGKLSSLVADKGWEIAAKIKDRGDNVWLAYRADEETIKDLYVVALSDDELVLVRAHGNIDHLVTRAIRDHVQSGAPLGIPGI